MNDKPKMYQNKISKEINNNRVIYMSNNTDKKSNIGNSDIRKKINDIINSNTFIYSKRVNIVIGNESNLKSTNSLSFNKIEKYIPIDNIYDIYK